MNYRLILGNNIRSIRIKMGFSQEILAERSNLHRTYIGGVERGERNISLDNISRIAEALEVDIRILFTLEGDDNGEKEELGKI